MSRETGERRQAATFSLILLATACAAVVLFGGFRPAMAELGPVRFPALPPILLGLALPALALLGIPVRAIPALCHGGAAIALSTIALWALAPPDGRQSSGFDILQAALAACALGLIARGLAWTRGRRRDPVRQGA